VNKDYQYLSMWSFDECIKSITKSRPRRLSLSLRTDREQYGLDLGFDLLGLVLALTSNTVVASASKYCDSGSVLSELILIAYTLL